MIESRVQDELRNEYAYFKGQKKTIDTLLGKAAKDDDISSHLQDEAGVKNTSNYSLLERKIEEHTNRYASLLGSTSEKLSRAIGGATLFSNMYNAFVSFLPTAGSVYAATHTMLVLAKKVPEIALMYKMALKDHDKRMLLDTGKWLGMSAIELAVPVLGPMLGTGYMRRMIKQRILYNAKRDFLEEIGARKPQISLLDKLDAHVRGKGHSIQDHGQRIYDNWVARTYTPAKKSAVA